MKRTRSLSTLLCLFAMLFVLLSGTTVFAHPRTQKGILAETTIDPEYSSYYVGSFVGGDAVGWRIMEERHTNGTEQTYSFDTSDPDFTNTLKSYVRTGAAM